jgi:hypothetical protein
MNGIRSDISHRMRYVAANTIHPAWRGAPDGCHISFNAIRFGEFRRRELMCDMPPALKNACMVWGDLFNRPVCGFVQSGAAISLRQFDDLSYEQIKPVQ